MDMHSPNGHGGNGGAGNVGRWAFWGFILIAGYFLFAEHRAHLLGILPYLLVLACPLMHMFHHHGHRHGGGPGADVASQPGESNASGSAPSHPDQ